MSEVRIIDAGVQRGWDPCDHLIDDEPAHALIGRTYGHRGAMIAAVSAAERTAWPISVTYTCAGVTRRRFLTGSPTVHRVDRIEGPVAR